MIEEWKKIIDFPNYVISNNGTIVNITTDKFISVSIHKHGHHVVRLWSKGKTRLFKLYRLLAIHFIANPENKREVNHKDGDRLNYSLENLEWCTPSENMKHAFNTGLTKNTYKKMFSHVRCKLTLIN